MSKNSFSQRRTMFRPLWTRQSCVRTFLLPCFALCSGNVYDHEGSWCCWHPCLGARRSPESFLGILPLNMTHLEGCWGFGCLLQCHKARVAKATVQKILYCCKRLVCSKWRWIHFVSFQENNILIDVRLHKTLCILWHYQYKPSNLDIITVF